MGVAGGDSAALLPSVAPVTFQHVPQAAPGEPACPPPVPLPPLK